MVLDSPVVRQFMRNNVNANTLPYDFIDGSDEYTSVFDFLNPCDAYNVPHINQDWDYYNSGSYNPQLDFKSGFPWKQNNIRKYAVAFGEHDAIGNTEDHLNYACIRLNWKLFGFPGGATLNHVVSEWYDTCPGSYFPTEFHYQQRIFPEQDFNSTLEQFLGWVFGADDFRIKFNVNYDLPVVPVISSLCITNREFAEPYQTQHTPYSSTIAEPVQTPFDDYYIPFDASSHQVLSPQTATWIRNSLYDFPASEGIIGQITATMRFGAQVLANQPFVITDLSSGIVYNVTSNGSGIIQFNNLYINTCIYEIKHADGIYYPQLVTVNVDMFGNSDAGIVVFTAPISYVEVNQSPTSDACHTLSNAFELCKGTGISHIIVRAGTYRENISTFDLGFNAEHFILEGDGSTVIMQSAVRGHPLYIYQSSAHTINELTIRNIIFEDSDSEGGGGLSLGGNIIHATIENCTIRNCGDNYFVTGAENIPVGLSATIPIHINNCDFYDNEGASFGSTNRSLGVIYLYVNQQTQPSIIENCRIHDNSADNASAIFVSGRSQFIIRNNVIRNNYQKHYIGDLYCIYSKDAQDVEIINNIIDNNMYPPNVGRAEYAIGVKRTSANPTNSNAFIANNTIAYHRRALYVKNVNVNMINNLIDVYNVGLYCEQGYDQSMLQYSHNFMKTYTGTIMAENYIILSDQGNQTGDPKVDANFQPIWNSSDISPCIDTGIGAADLDGTPPDIGAVPAMTHRHWEHEFTNQADVDKWYWVSYPILNTITNNALVASEFFKELLHAHLNSQDEYTPTYLESITWYSSGNPNPSYILWDNDFWNSNYNTHFVSSPQGYKIKLKSRSNPDFPGPVILQESGYKTSANLQFPIYGNEENWLGYFKEEPSKPVDAFSAIWDDINMIKTKSWCIIRDVNGNLVGKSGPLNFGDMVIVTTNNYHNFRWGSGSTDIPHIKETPTYFVYDEKQDYIPMYISLPDSMMTDLEEIGLYVDGVCKGAVVVDDSLEQISAYVDSSSELSEGAVELVFYYEEAKRLDHQLQAMTLKPGRLETKYGATGNKYPYFEVKITQDDLDNIVAPVFSLKQNYPNPFNPTTTISFSLPEAARVRLDIYNLKGQLVRTLLNSDKGAGLHSVVWNGKDKHNVAVGSGVYFYRISSPKHTQTKKMLLMK
ncbi:MAG: T9SS type A sorting domain-containing protein [Candidatus Cloacimonadaceae bacterium]|nr:T9SS type A sorting domain-containing protein [Candidatus Cloacimonadaceae bacterium]